MPVRDDAQSLIRPLIDDVVLALGSRARAPGLLAEQIGVDGTALARMLAGDDDPRTDVAMAAARAAGGIVIPLPLSMPAEGFFGRPQLYVDPMQVAGDLLRLRRLFADWREGLKLSPSGLARSCGIQPSAVISCERGGTVPLLSSSERHARRFGTTLRVIEAGALNRTLARLEQFRRRQTPFLRRQIEVSRGTTPKWRIKTPAMSAADVATATLFEAAAANGIGPDALALRAGVDRRTLMRPDAAVQPLGRMSVATKVAAALGMDLVLVPKEAAGEVEQSAQFWSASPAVRTRSEIRAAARRQMSAMIGTLVAIERRLRRRGGPAAEAAGYAARTLSESNIEAVGRRCENLGMALLAVPSDGAAAAEEIGSRFPLRLPGRPRREPSGVTGRNARLASGFMGTWLRLAPGLRFAQPKVSLQAVLDASPQAGIALEITDVRDGALLHSQTGGRADAAFGRLVGLRRNRGLSLKAVSEAVGLTPPAVKRMERNPQGVLLTSALRYAEAIGTRLAPARAARAAA